MPETQKPPRETDKKCLHPECHRPVHVRGLCTKHYQTALYQVERGQINWETLERARKCLPRKTGRIARNWFTEND
jgi:hypothetical protein